MNKNSMILISALFFIIALNSCKVLYFPNAHNTPMLSQKGELQVAGGLDTWLSFNLQSAYALSDNLGIMLNGKILPNNMYDSENKVVNENPILYGETAMGYSKQLDENSRFEIYGGGGIGNSNGNFYDEVDRDYKFVEGTLSKFFIQPSIGITQEYKTFFRSIVEYDFTLRMAAVTLLNETKLFAEPGFVFKIGGKSVRFIVGYGYSIRLTGKEPSKWDHAPHISNLGLTISLNRKPFKQ